MNATCAYTILCAYRQCAPITQTLRYYPQEVAEVSVYSGTPKLTKRIGQPINSEIFFIVRYKCMKGFSMICRNKFIMRSFFTIRGVLYWRFHYISLSSSISPPLSLPYHVHRGEWTPSLAVGVRRGNNILESTATLLSNHAYGRYTSSTPTRNVNTSTTFRKLQSGASTSSQDYHSLFLDYH